MMFGCVSLYFVVSDINKPIYNAVLILNNIRLTSKPLLTKH